MLHLIHPALIHFTVAFLVVGGLCEAVALLARREALETWGNRLLLIGFASMIPTLVSGYLAANTLSLPDGGQALLDTHERNGWILFVLLLASQFWKAWCGGKVAGVQRWPYAALLLAAVALTAYSAWLGGRMVYGLGIGVT